MNCRTESLLLSSLMLLGIVTVFFSSSPIGTSVERFGENVVNLAATTVSGSHRQGTISDQVAIEAPVIQGWGGVTLDEASNGQMQSTLQRLNQSGYNAVRVGFSASITPCSSGELGDWSSAWFSQTIQIAQQYNMWVILDYHSYRDLIDGCQLEWLSFWSGVLSTNWGYARIVWEPINEPAGSVSLLSSAYQTWITQARALGDTHWIAVENTISNGGCAFDFLSLVGRYPSVTDPLN
ncbi:MAG TPA: cellulase family glycosylhydrolase [Candidatus Bathyarchaeia archaeon]